MRRLTGFLLLAGLLASLPPVSAGERGTFVLTGTVTSTIDRSSPGIVGVDLVINPMAYPIVRTVFANTPAHEKGLVPGDFVLAVDGESTRGKSRAEVDALISNVPGTPVTLTIRRGMSIQDKTLVVRSLKQSSDYIRSQYAGLFPE